MPSRDIDTDNKIFPAGRDLLPASKLFARFSKYPDRYWRDQSGFFCDRNKSVWRDEADIGMMPAKQGFKTDEVAVLKRDDRLVVKPQLVSFDRVAQIHLKACTFKESFAQILRENGNTAVLFASIMHRDIRVTKDLFRCVVFNVTGSNTYVNADRNSIAAKRERLRDTTVDTASDFLRFSDG